MDAPATRLDRIPVTALKGVGPRSAPKLHKLGLETVQDLLFHLPLRYEDRTRVVAMGALRAGQWAVVEGQVDLAEVKFGKRRSLLVRISDGTGALTLRFFHFSKLQQQGFQRGTRIRCYGEARPGAVTLEMVHPEYQRLEEEVAPAVEESLTPVYPATEGVHQLTLRRLADQALQALEGSHEQVLPDWLPPELLTGFPFTGLAEAIRYVHRPPPEASVAQLLEGRHPAQQRLAFEELLAHHLSLRRLRHEARAQHAPVLKGDGALRAALLANLPFQLTAAQRRVGAEIASDLRQSHPMLRLVQGDVGSGKTLVAAVAVLQAIEAGCQAAVMAPTELLAEQHYRNFAAWLEPLGVTVAWLTGRIKGKARSATLTAIESGTAQLVVGTHALFQDEVTFAHLGLVVVDEQHRFGVHQRLALRDKGRKNGLHPHQLVMTATPIPRTLAMTLYADLDSSVIDELPPGRTPVQTVAIPGTRRPEVMARVREACAAGRQAYWVCTLIEESEVLQCEAAADTAELLREQLPELRIGLVHGRLKAAEKEAVMRAFQQRELDLLVATTVIEVGVDVPNASLMIIENAERLGLSQLHQLRGRVGRGAAKSSCVLLYQTPLSRTAKVRINTMRETNDGFLVAQKDLELRGPGEVLGTRQTGLAQFHIADLLRDAALLEPVERVAEQLLQQHPDHVPHLIRRWLGQAEQYGAV
ncbi:MAG: ATP-dependent DNA helicase RecG [Gammaproteobacteria bacterium]|nr:ATP-dependent DNA helicase RecG [Gammaproteobacteria bacterium]